MTKRGVPTPWRPQREVQDRTQKRKTEQGVLTDWRPQREEVRTQKGSDQARGTHILGTTEGGTSQDMEGKQLNKGYSPTGDHRERDTSGYGKKGTKQGELTSWRPQGEGQVRT